MPLPESPNLTQKKVENDEKNGQISAPKVALATAEAKVTALEAAAHEQVTALEAAAREQVTLTAATTLQNKLIAQQRDQIKILRMLLKRDGAKPDILLRLRSDPDPENKDKLVLDSEKVHLSNGQFVKVGKIFNASTTQEQLYEQSSELLHALLYLKSILIFFYGGTGSGKSHTAIGTTGDMGLLSCLLLGLLSMPQDLGDQTTLTISYSIVEV